MKLNYISFYIRKLFYVSSIGFFFPLPLFSSQESSVELNDIMQAEDLQYSGRPLNETERVEPINTDLEELLKKQPSGSGLLKKIESYATCCGGYHLGCQSFWSSMNGPLGVSSLLSSAASTTISGLAAAALFSDPSLVHNLAIAGTVTSVSAAVLGSLKMYAASRSSTELVKATDAILASYTSFLETLKEGRDKVAAKCAADPANTQAQTALNAWNQAVTDNEQRLITLLEYTKIIKEHHQAQLDVQGKEQNFILTATNMNAVLGGNISTQQPNFPTGYKCCQTCLHHYDMTTFTFYNIAEGPAGLLNTLFSTAGAVLLAFSIFNTGNVQAGLVYASAASNGAATAFAALKFYAGARVKSALSRLSYWTTSTETSSTSLERDPTAQTEVEIPVSRNT